MQKRYKIILSILLVLTFSIVGSNIAWMNTARPGTTNNPLVSKGYLDNVINAQQQKYTELHNQYKALEDEIADLREALNKLATNPSQPNEPSEPSQPTEPSNPTPPPSTTNAKATVVVDASTVNFRSGNNTSASIVTRVNKGDEIVAIKYDNEWIQGTINNQTGWIAAWLVKNKTAHQVAYVSSSLVNARSGAGTNHSIVTQLRLGDIVRILSVQNDWAKVVLPDGKEAWIFRPLLETL